MRKRDKQQEINEMATDKLSGRQCRPADPESIGDTKAISNLVFTNMKNNMASDNIIETQDLTKTFGAGVAVQSLSMQVPRGTIFGFVGPSGCGKTTTVLCWLLGSSARFFGFLGRNFVRQSLFSVLGGLVYFMNTHWGHLDDRF
jgi:ABC-type glutathione transport system ATPase component